MHSQIHTSRTLLALAAVAVGGFMAAPAAAQTPTLTFVGETGGDDVSVILGSASFGGSDVGLAPVFGLTSYLLVLEGDGDTDTGVTVEPWVGLRTGFDGGYLQGTVGYAWNSEDDDDAGTRGFPFQGGGESGITVGGQLGYWGSGSLNLNAGAHYNIESSYLWTRGGATVPVAPWSGGNLALGGEVTWQSDLDDSEGLLGIGTADDYEALQFGPVLQWTSDRMTGTLGAGWKQLDEEFGDDTWYFRFGLSFMPG